MSRPVASGLNTVKRRRADGSTITAWYHRRTGALIGRSDEGMTRDQAIERRIELDAEEGVESGPPPGSFGELCVLYKGSNDYKKLGAGTKAEYDDHIEILRAAWERVPRAGITRLVVASLHKAYEDRPWRGNAILRTLRLIINYGIKQLQLEDLTRNPVDGFTMFDTPARTQIWDRRRIDAFLNAASELERPKIRLGMAILLYTVQRASDTLDMTRPQMWKGEDDRWWIRLRQAKTGAPIDVPCHGRLVEEMEREREASAAIARQREAQGLKPLPDSVLLLASPTGKRWSRRNFSRTWDRVERRANLRLARQSLAAAPLPPVSQAKAREKAKRELREQLITDLQRRDLRRTGVVQMAIPGATTPQIAALAGWSIDTTQKIVDTYLPRKGEVALGGVKRWEETPEDAVIVLATKRRKRP